MKHRFLTLLFMVMLAASSSVYTQGSFTSSLSGTIVDSSGGLIPGADVKVKNNGTAAEYSAVTADNGTFSIPALLPGSYSVTVSLMGFKTAALSAVTVNASSPASVRVSLEVGRLEESVSVVAESASVVQTQTSAITTTMDINQISNLPLASRNALDVITSLPGVNTAAGNRDSTVSGLPQSAINITLDGMSIQDNYLKATDGFFARLSPRIDAVEEVTVTTAANGADASGQGAIQIRFVTRSGSNTFTGSAYHYYRNDALNANTWFNNRDLPRDPVTGKAPKADLVQHQPGVRVGGPIVIPGLWDGHNKGFFFVNYEQLRQPSQRTLNRTILHPRAQEGVFRYNVGGAVREVNLLQLAAANGQLSTLDPTVAKILADIHAATQKTGQVQGLDNPLVQRYTFQNPTKNLNPYPTVRFDYNVSKNHRLMGSYNYQHIDSTPDTTNNRDPSFPGFPVTGSQQSTRWTTSESLRSTIGQNMVNEFRIGGTGGATLFSPEFSPSMWKGTPVADQGGFHLNFNTTCCGTGSQLTNVDTTGNPTYQAREASTRVVEDTLTWIKGSHSLSVGTGFTQGDLWITQQMLVPTIAFGLVPGEAADAIFNATTLPGASTTDIQQAKNLYAMLTGRVNSITADARLTESADRYVFLGPGTARARLRELDFFAQDSWRIRSNVTINYGLRYALQLPFYPRNSAYTTASIEDIWGVSGVGNLFKAGTLTGQKPAYEQFKEGAYAYKTDRNNFAPTVGFAWTPGGKTGLLGKLLGADGDSVIRGGFALAYERHGMSDFSDIYGANPGLRITGVTDRTQALGTLGPLPVLLRNPGALAPPVFSTTPSYPITPVFSDSVNTFDTNLQVPYSQSWTLGFQRKVSRDTAFEVRYVGTRHLDDWVTYNHNEPNIVENGFLNEFRKAQANLEANIAAGRGNTFAYTGVPGTSPLPIFLAHYNAVAALQASDPTKYTGSNWTNATFLGFLAKYNPQPFSFASATNITNGLIGNQTFRRNALIAGMPANFFIANPEVTGANLTANGTYTRYSSLQFELRKRLSRGVQFQSGYSFGKAYESVRYGFRKSEVSTLQTGVDGNVTHAFKGNWLYELPFGREHRFASNVGRIMDRIIGGWSFDGVARIQTGQMLDFGDVRLVGMSKKEFQKAFKLRFAENGQVYMLPQDIIDNTVRAFSVSATSPTGYSSLAPTGRYLSPANGPDCIETSSSSGDCGLRSLIVTGPELVRFDLSIVKAVRLAGGTTFTFRAEMLNAFNRPYFTPVTGFTTTTFNGVGNTQTSNSPSPFAVPIGNASTNNADAFRITGLSGGETARVIQLVTRITW